MIDVGGLKITSEGGIMRNIFSHAKEQFSSSETERTAIHVHFEIHRLFELT